MTTDLTVGFSNDGKHTHYVVDNSNLANNFNIDTGNILNTTYITENITASNDMGTSLIPATQFADGGEANWNYAFQNDQNVYNFMADGWNVVKNISAIGSGDEKITILSKNFVHADMDFSNVTERVQLIIENGKRGNYTTGSGNDLVLITSATNNAGWSNIHKINTGDGRDIVMINGGEDSLIGSTIVNHTNGYLTTVYADLGNGGDRYFASDARIASKDFVWGKAGNDTIFTGQNDDTVYGGEGNDTIRGGQGNDILFGEENNDQIYGEDGDDTIYGGVGEDNLRGGADNDIIYGGSGNDDIRGEEGNDIIWGGENDTIINKIGEGLYDVDTQHDYIFGGEGDDTFNYTDKTSTSVGDGFDVIVDFSNDDALNLFLESTDVVTTEVAGITYDPINAPHFNGTMILINDDPAVFLDNYYINANTQINENII